MNPLLTDPAWSDGLLFIALIPVALLVVAGLQELALYVAARSDQRSRS